MRPSASGCDRGGDSKVRLFDPRSGADVGPWKPFGLAVVDWIANLHDNLFAGPVGRTVNLFGAIVTVLLAATGLTVWWPGVERWHRSLVLRRGVGWKRFVWDLHGVIGFWSFAFILVFGLSGIYLCAPEEVQAFADWLEPLTDANSGGRFVDGALYWLAYLHFGRIQGIGIPCAGPGLLRSGDEGGLGAVRLGAERPVRDRHRHVVEPRAAALARRVIEGEARA